VKLKRAYSSKPHTRLWLAYLLRQQQNKVGLLPYQQFDVD
jgi:hypothetical protein